MKTIYPFIIFILLGFISNAQQGIYSQYMFNGLALNPAYAGSDGTLSLTGLTRHQWVGIEGAPNSQTFSMHAPIKSKKIAVGMMLYNDKIGVSKTTSLYGSGAYLINFEKSTLSMGLQFGFTSFQYNYSDLENIDQNDVAVSENINEPFKPNAGMGLYYYSKKHFVGFSLPTLINSTVEINSSDIPNSASNIVTRHVFLTGGYSFTINHHLILTPSTLIRYVSGNPLHIDINANLEIDEVLHVGISYKGESISGLFQILLTQSLRFGYAYDYGLTDLNTNHSGSHELMLNYRFEFKKDKLSTPRSF